MKRFWLPAAILLLFSVPLVFVACQANSKTEAVSTPVADTARVNRLSREALVFCRQKKYDTTFCFLVDMSIHSGKNRFLVWNFKEKKITQQAMVTHGCGKSPWGTDHSSTTPVFSNVAESHCSSLGKYKVGERGYSQWGIHVKYLLHGLEATNNNALARTIVLHSWEAVSDKETYPDGAPESWGCPAVSNNFMRKLDTLLQATDKPVLLWMMN